MSALRFQGVLLRRAEARVTREGEWGVYVHVAQVGGGVNAHARMRFGSDNACASLASAKAARLVQGAHIIVHGAGFTVEHIDGHHVLQIIGVDMLELLHVTPTARRERVDLERMHERYVDDMLTVMGLDS